MLAPNTILQNRYRVIRELGHGGMGTVYEALDQRVNCLVALKEMFGTQDGEARKAFEREAALLANLRHQALPKVMDYFSESEGDFLVMEFIAGHDLAALLASRGSPFPQSQVLSWADELLKLLEYLHTRQPPILHRDIKPANLKLTEQGEIFLLDFGLAKGSTGQMLTLATSRSIFGYTPSYASLEQILGQGTDARSDIYSLGATLYHLLTGIAPVDAPTRFHIIEDEQPDPLQPIGRVNPLTSSRITAVIHQAMAIARKQRPASASEMRKVLRIAVEEDDRSRAEEDYARSEARRRAKKSGAKAEPYTGTHAHGVQREAEKRKEEEARQDAEFRRKDEVVQRRTEDRVIQEGKKRGKERSLRRAEERNKEEKADGGNRSQVPKTVFVSTVGTQEPSLIKRASQRVLEAIHASPRNDPSFYQFIEAQRRRAPTIAVIRKRKLVSGGVLLVVFAGVAFLIWFLSGKSTSLDESSKSQPSPETVQTSNRPSSTLPLTRTNQAGIEFVMIPSGKFMMGSTNGEADEKPVHQVTISQPFYMGKYEVTQAQWQAVMGNNPSKFKNCGGNCPVEQVSWDDAQNFINNLNKSNDGFRYRLPTEAEWEYACRGGTTGDYAGTLSEMAWFSENSGSRTHPVGQKQSNAWGLADMHGNVWEWCQDWYHLETSYYGAPSDGSAWSGGEQKIRGEGGRVLRGGSWDPDATRLRSAARSANSPDDSDGSVGFRVVAVR